MSGELTLFQIKPAELDNIESFLIQKYEEYNDEDTSSLELSDGFAEVLHFLLTGSSDFSGAWFVNSEPLIKEVSISGSDERLLLIDALAGGVWLKPHEACYLAPEQVHEISQALSTVIQENLGARWDLLSEFCSSEHRKVVGDLERLQASSQRLEQVVWNVAEFTTYFAEEFVAYYADASSKGMGIIISDHS